MADGPGGAVDAPPLAARGLSPRGEPVAFLRWRRRAGRAWIERFAYLYPDASAVPKRPVTPGMARSLAAALAARRWCPSCRRDVGYCLPRRYGVCGACVALAEAA